MFWPASLMERGLPGSGAARTVGWARLYLVALSLPGRGAVCGAGLRPAAPPAPPPRAPPQCLGSQLGNPQPCPSLWPPGDAKVD